jgi:alpha-tubulin suppressor-like RCC1 family protein
LANVVAVAAGNSHSMALKSDGTVMCWGSNIKGQATPPTGLAGVIAIAAAGDFCLALKSDRTVVGWGANDLGQISPPAALNNVVAIAAGQNHGLALTWAPVSIFAHPQNQTVVAGSTVTFAVGATGSQPMTFQWQRNGTNLPGATNATLVIGNVQTNHAGTYTVLVGNPVGTITSSNAALTVLVPPTITTQPQSQSVPLGAIVSFSVEAAGTPPFGYQWRKEGSNLPNANLSSLIIPNAQPGDQGKYTVLVTNIAGEATSASATLMVLMPPVILLQPQSQTVVAGSSVLFELVATGATTYQWRKNNQNIPGATAAIYPINSAQTNDAGSYTVAVSGPGGSVTSQAAILMVLTPATTNFNLAHWGQSLVFNGTNYVDVTPPGITGVVAIAVGGNHSLALKRDGTIAGWGDNIYGQAAAAGLTSVKAIAAGFNHSLALRSNGTVVAWGQNHQGQASVPVGLSSIIAIAAGVNHSLALRQNGAVIGWGENTFGKATAPPTATNLAAIAAARDHSLALKADGTVVAWGGNDDGQLQAPLGLTNVIAIAAGDHHSLVLKADGTVVGWGALRGLYDYGQANPPPNLSGVMAIAAGGTHSLALLRNNTVVAWGNNNYAQSTIPAGLAGVAAIAAGPTRSLALRLRPLRLHLEKQGGLFRLTAGNLDLSVLAEERLSNLELYTTTNVSLSLSNWTKLTNSLTLANGQAIYLETNGATFQRNYLIIEKP